MPDDCFQVSQRLTSTLPIELINDQLQERKIHSLERKKEKYTHETAQHKTLLHFSIDGCQHLHRDKNTD